MTKVLRNLQSLIEFASKASEKVFRQTGHLAPMYHAITDDERHLVMIPPPGIGKDLMVNVVKAAFKEQRVDRFVFVDEAWMLYAKLDGPPLDIERIHREGLRDHPDRREIVMFAAENRQGEMQTASRFILRPEHGNATLAPLKMDDMSRKRSAEGRMVGLLK